MGYSIRLQFLFDKYLQRQCTSEEVEEMISLLQQADADEMLSEPMQELWNRLKSDQSAYDVDWDKMFTAVRDSEENISFSFSEKSNALRRTWYKIAAAAVILIGSAGAYLYFSNHANTNQQPVIANAKNIKNQQPENKRQTIYLPDGSTVILNAESKLNYPSSFSGKTREVFLSGEAYFDIKHNPQQPFMVHAGKITTKVLGTSFNVKAYPADESIEVTVTRGKVQVLKENTSLGLVTANQQISFSKKTEAYSQKKVDARLIVAWKPEEIIFNDITMREAAKKIEQRFNTTVEFANPAVMGCRVTATFSEDDMAEEMLTVICGVTKTNYRIINNKIVIDGKGCNE